MRLVTLSRLVFAFGILIFILFAVNLFEIVVRLWSNHERSSSPVSAAQATIENRMADRLQLVKQVCRNYRSTDLKSHRQFAIPHPPTPQYSVLYFQLEKRMMYCPVYKAASTSMLHWLLKMKGVDSSSIIEKTHRQISDISRQYYPSLDYPEADQLLNKSKRWMVVRHPFERILSAYRDKLENSTAGHEHGTLHFYEKYGRKIVDKYRMNHSNQQQPRREPSFEEFVRYLIDTDLALYADDHWIPYYLYCTPCLIDYDFILHFETLKEDVDLLLTAIGEETGPEWKHSTYSNAKSSRTALIRSYYDQLSEQTIGKLYDKYRVDFELFGYSVDSFLPKSTRFLNKRV